MTHLTDFSDRFSPMLVKELRQGMRAKTFIGLFLVLQAFLAVMMLSAGSASSSDHAGSVISSIIFSFFSIAVLVVQPLRGTTALSSEIKGNTIDMMVLTRLSAWRIVFGKWVAIVSQTTLLLTTIIPYLILRYFFGGMNLVGELVLLALIFLTSMALTALTVGLSACSSFFVRSLLPIIGLPILMWSLLIMMLSSGFRGSGFLTPFMLDSTESRVGVAVYVFALVYLGASMLSLATSFIAPAAENHALWRRLAAIVLLLAVLAAGFLPDLESSVTTLLAVVIAGPAMFIALSESAPLVTTVCKPFARRGPLVRALGWLFYPTQGSGYLAGIAIGLLALASILIHLVLRNAGGSSDPESLVVILSIFGALLFPAVWQTFFFKGEGQRVAQYLVLLVASAILCGILAALADSMNHVMFLIFFAWHPLAFLAMLAENSVDESIVAAAAAVVDILLIIILLFKALAEIRKAEPVISAARCSGLTDDQP